MKRVRVIGLLCALLLGIAAGALAASKDAQVAVLDGSIKPVAVTIARGQAVRWTNHGRQRHSLRSSTKAFPPFALSPGATHRVSFARLGVYGYVVDEQRGGVVIVLASTPGQTTTTSRTGGRAWSGSIASHTKLLHDTRVGGGWPCTALWKGTFTFQAYNDGTVSGSGHAAQVGRAACAFKQLPDPKPETFFTVAGQASSSTLTLEFKFSNLGATRHDYGGFFQSFFGGAALQHTYKLSIAPPGSAHGEYDVSYSLANGVQHVTAHISLAAR